MQDGTALPRNSFAACAWGVAPRSQKLTAPGMIGFVGPAMSYLHDCLDMLSGTASCIVCVYVLLESANND